MKDIIFSCPTLRNELEKAMELEGSNTPIKYLPQSLHSDPEELGRYVQNEIDKASDYDRIFLCVSGCGGGTKDLKATNGIVVIPKTSDCIDIALSGGDERKYGEIYITNSWMEFMINAGMDMDSLIKERGEEGAVEHLKWMFNGFPNFNIIDTGTYDISDAIEFAKPIVEAIDGNLKILTGKYEILRKIAAGTIDDDFYVLEKEDK